MTTSFFINMFEQKKTRIYFLFSYNDKNKIEFPSFKSSNYFKSYKIDYKDENLELFEITGSISHGIQIKIDNNIYLLPITDTLKKNNFLFNKFLIKENSKLKIKLNSLNINEEFDIYYAFFNKKSNEAINDLISSSLDLLKENSTLSFYLNIFMKHPKIYINNEKILLDIMFPGDLSNLDIEYFKNILKNESIIYSDLEVIFYIFKDIDYIKKNITTNNYKSLIFDCLDKYRKLFRNSVSISFSTYSFLICESDSIQRIKSVLKCIDNFTDFINIINENKEHISKFIKNIKKDDLKKLKDNKNLIIIDEFFDIEAIFSEAIKENTYISLISIREFETKNNQEILCILSQDFYKTESLIRKMIFLYFRGFETKKLLLFFNQKKDYLKNFSFNNYEILAIFDILYNGNVNDNFIILEYLLKQINYCKIDNDLINFYSEMKLEVILGNLNYFEKIISTIIYNITNLKGYEFLFILINKIEGSINNFLIEGKKEIENEDKGFFKMKDEIKEINFIISKLQEKYIQIWKDNSIQNTEEDDIIKISSKLMFISETQKSLIKFLDNLLNSSDEKKVESLGKIIIYTLENYEISNLNVGKIFALLVENLNKKTHQIIDLFIGTKSTSQKIVNIVNKFLIDDKDLFLEKDNINYELLEILNKNKYFEIDDSSTYSQITIKRLKNISERIIKKKNISFNQILFLFNNKNRLELFSLIDNYESLKNEISNIISKINEIIEKINKYISNFRKLKFSTNHLIDVFKLFIDDIKTKDINLINDIERKMQSFFEFFKNLEEKINSNYFFKSIKDQYKQDEDIFILFEQILFLFDISKIDKISSKLIKIFPSFLLLNNEDQNNIISNLSECNYLYQSLYINNELMDKPYKKITSGDKMVIKKRIIKLSIKEKINEIYQKYLIFKEKIFNRNYKDINLKKEIKDNRNKFTLELFSDFSSFLGINESLYLKKESKEILKEIEDKKFIKIIKLLENEKAFNFLLNINSQDCRNLQELAGEVHGGNNQNFISIEELLNIESIVETFESIKKSISNDIKERNLEDKEIIKSINEQIDEEELKKYIDKYQQYEEFFTENLDKSKFTAEIIQKILNNSKIFLINNDNNNFKAYYQDEENTFNKKKEYL